MFFRSCLNEARSDGVSILDTNEIPCLAFREAVEAVAKDSFPPIFDLFAMLFSESSQCAGLQRECGGIRPAGQCRRPQDAAAAMNEEPAQVRKGATLPDEVVDHEVLAARGDGTLEHGGSDHALPAGCAGVVDDVGLNDSDLDFEIQPFGQQLCKGAGNPVVSQVLYRVNGNQRRPPISEQRAD